MNSGVRQGDMKGSFGNIGCGPLLGTSGSVSLAIMVALAVGFSTIAEGTVTYPDAVTNFTSKTYSNDDFFFASELVTGRATAWGSATSNVRSTFDGCHAEINGRIFVTGYFNNGITLQNGAYVKAASYLDDLGTRNSSIVSSGSVLVTEGEICLDDGYPNSSSPYPFTVDGGTVTNGGAFKIASDGAGNAFPVRIINGSKWVQGTGETTLNCKNDAQLMLAITNGSSFVSGGAIALSPGKASGTAQMLLENDSHASFGSSLVIGGTVSGVSNCGLRVADNSTFTNKGVVSVGRASGGNAENLYIEVENKSDFFSSSSFSLAGKGLADKNKGFRVLVTNGSKFSVNSFDVGADGVGLDGTTIAVTNSAFSVKGATRLPLNTLSRRLDFSICCTDGNSASASFEGGLIIGAANHPEGTIREAPTTFVVDGALVTVGVNNTSGDCRLGSNATVNREHTVNRLVISGKKGCFAALHRMMTSFAGEEYRPHIVFNVPDGGYDNAYGTGLYVNHGYLDKALLKVDVKDAKQSGSYVLVKSPYEDLQLRSVDTIELMNKKPDYKYGFELTKTSLTLTVKQKSGLILVVR